MPPISGSSIINSINASFSQLNSTYADIRNNCAKVSSLRRREAKICSSAFGTSDESSENALATDILGGTRTRLRTSIADMAAFVFENLNEFRLMALNILSLCESWHEMFKCNVLNNATDICASDKVCSFLSNFTKSMIDEIDLISFNVYASIFPEIVNISTSPSFELSSRFLTDKMMSHTLWTDEICPLLSSLEL